ncbi:MAG: hypothetical protein ACRDXE_09055 [Acidimicrobiales bacterium]
MIRGSALGRVVLVATAGAVALAAGCGSSAPTITSAASAQLSQQVQAIRADATAGNLPAARQQLSTLKGDVNALAARHAISAAKAAEILAAAGTVAGQLTAGSTPTTSPATTSTTTSEPATSTTLAHSPPTKPSDHKGHGGGDHQGSGGD